MTDSTGVAAESKQIVSVVAIRRDGSTKVLWLAEVPGPHPHSNICGVSADIDLTQISPDVLSLRVTVSR